MVKIVRILKWMGSAALFATMACSLPVRAQSIIDQMQREFEAIVANSRVGIVSIEDERIFGQGRQARQGKQQGDNDLVLQIKRQLEEVENRIAQLKARFTANNPQLKAAVKEQEMLEARLN